MKAFFYFYIDNKPMKLLLILFLSLYITQAAAFTKKDTLLGSNGMGRNWWNVLHYDVQVDIDIDNHFIEGKTILSFNLVNVIRDSLQIDLQEPLKITSLFCKKRNSKDSIALDFKRDQDLYWINFAKQSFKKGDTLQLIINYEGKPTEAKNPPWDGGFVWKKDINNKPWVSVACQGKGASCWFPCKDLQSDEPDWGARIAINPSNNQLRVVSNGIEHELNDTVAVTDPISNEQSIKVFFKNYFTVSNPINNYDITFYIGDYVKWTDTLNGEKGILPLSFYVLKNNEQAARKQFTVVKPMLHCFESWMGPYPFYEDGYKLVEAPFLGMEHQSAVAYGNQYQMGYLGKDRSKTGFGLQFDFIIVHESAHEWFGNSITASDVAYNWIHEGWTTYAEALFAECLLDKESANAYALGTWEMIQNEQNVQAEKGVHKEGADIYTKGAAIVHMIRKMINNDDQFKQALRKMNQSFYHQIVTENQLESYWESALSSIMDKSNVKTFFNQYLRTTDIPKLETKLENGKFSYRFSNCLPNFTLPIVLSNQKDASTKYPTSEWKSVAEDNLMEDWESILENYLIEVE